MSIKPPIWRLLYWMRDLRSKEVFRALEKYCRGEVLDVGGYDFYLIVNKKKINYTRWTTLEYSKDKTFNLKDDRFRLVIDDGCNMQFEDNSFDTVLNIQVLEHVFEPTKMIEEIARVLKPSGYGVFLIPQTGVIHYTPEHYYNFTRFWIQKAMKNAGLEIIELKPLGGIWSSMASHLFHFFFQSIRFEGMSTLECKRNFMFYLLYPLMVLYALINIPICMVLSLGDLTEEPNNHFVLVRKN